MAGSGPSAFGHFPDSAMNPFTQAWVARVADNGGTVTAPQIVYVDRLVASMAAAGILGRCLYMLTFAGTNLNAVLTPVVKGAGSAIATNYSFTIANAASGGLEGDGPRCIDTGLDVAAIPQSGNAFSLLCLTSGGLTARSFAGCANYQIGRASSTQWRVRNFRTSYTSPTTLGSAPLVLTSERGSAPTFDFFENTTNLISTADAALAATGNIFGFATDAVGTGAAAVRLGLIAVFNAPFVTAERAAWVSAVMQYRTDMGWP